MIGCFVARLTKTPTNTRLCWHGINLNMTANAHAWDNLRPSPGTAFFHTVEKDNLGAGDHVLTKNTVEILRNGERVCLASMEPLFKFESIQIVANRRYY